MSSSTSNSKRFFIGFSVVLMVGSLFFVLGSEFIVRTTVMPNSTFDALRERLHTGHSAYGVFADSRGANGIRSQKDFENFSMAGDNLATIVAKAQFFVEKETTKGILIQADPHHFSSYRLNRNQTSLRDDLFKRVNPWLQFLRPVYRQYLLEYWKSFFLSKLERKKSVASTHGIDRLSEQPPAQAAINASIRLGLQTPLKEIERTHFARLYAEAINMFHQDGIDVCLVSFPVSAAYRKAAAAEPSYGHAKLYYENLAKQAGVKYLELSAALDDTYFSDPDHLNGDGAQALTETVLQKCFGLRR